MLKTKNFLINRKNRVHEIFCDTVVPKQRSAVTRAREIEIINKCGLCQFKISERTERASWKWRFHFVLIAGCKRGRGAIKPFRYPQINQHPSFIYFIFIFLLKIRTCIPRTPLFLVQKLFSRITVPRISSNIIRFGFSQLLYMLR